MTPQALIESTLRRSRPLLPLPQNQWSLARGIWAGRLSQGELFPFVPDSQDQFDLIWLEESPGVWSQAERPVLYTEVTFNWEAYHRHFSDNFHIPHWRAVKQGLNRLVHGRRVKVLFSNTCLHEWPGGKALPKRKVGAGFATHQGPLFQGFQTQGLIHTSTKVCLVGGYAQSAWPCLVQEQTELSGLEVLELGHPAYGHLSRSLQRLGL